MTKRLVVEFNKRVRQYQQAWSSLDELIKYYKKYNIVIKRRGNGLRMDIFDINHFDLCNTWIWLDLMTEAEYKEVLEEQKLMGEDI